MSRHQKEPGEIRVSSLRTGTFLGIWESGEGCNMRMTKIMLDTEFCWEEFIEVEV